MLSLEKDKFPFFSKFAIFFENGDRAVARALIGGGGVYIHIFKFCLARFFWNKIDFKRRQSGKTRIYEYTPPPPN